LMKGLPTDYVVNTVRHANMPILCPCRARCDDPANRLVRRPSESGTTLLHVTASTPRNATSGCWSTTRLVSRIRTLCCQLTTSVQFINLNTKSLHPGAMRCIFRELALHNISGEGLLHIWRKNRRAMRSVVVDFEAWRRLGGGACCSHAMTPSCCRFMLTTNRTIAAQTRCFCEQCCVLGVISPKSWLTTMRFRGGIEGARAASHWLEQTRNTPSMPTDAAIATAWGMCALFPRR
jgi:hypothetical protein